MGLAGLSIAMLGASANAEIESEFSLGYADEYIFRGMEYGDDLYEFGLDFSGTCDCGLDWNAGVWYGFFETPGLPEGDEELDIYAGVSKDFNGINLGLGVIRYIFPDDVTNNFNTTELYLSAGTTFNAIDLAATFYWTVDSESGSGLTGDWYTELTASYGFDLSETLSGEVGVGVAFFDATLSDGLANYSAHVSLTQKLSDDISISPYVQWTSNDQDYDATEADNLNAGIRGTFNF